MNPLTFPIFINTGSSRYKLESVQQIVDLARKLGLSNGFIQMSMPRELYNSVNELLHKRDSVND
jgi:hypothetical protein